MAIECKSLIVGESAQKTDVTAVEELLKSKSYLVSFNSPKTLHFGPESILLAVDVDFKDDLDIVDVEKYTVEIENNIRSINPKFDRIYIESKAL